MAIEQDEAGDGCPFMQQAPCARRKCRLYIKVSGVDRNTGKQVDGWECTEVWKVMLQIENSAVNRETGAAIESFRNEMVAANEASHRLTLAVMSGGKPKLLEG